MAQIDPETSGKAAVT